MIYLLLALSVSVNGVLVWYIKKLLTKYWFDVEARTNFTQMLEDYASSLEAIYKLEEFYGEETIKKAIGETKFVVKACKDFKEILEKETIEEAEAEEEGGEENSQADKKEAIIRLKEGESVSQDAASYKRVTPAPIGS